MNQPILDKEDYKFMLENLPKSKTRTKIDVILQIIELGEKFENDNIEVRKILENLEKEEKGE